MNKRSVSQLAAILVAVLVLIDQATVSDAVTCNVYELLPCSGALSGRSPISGACCAKLIQQKPCLCSYYRNPRLKEYFASPKARAIARSCHETSTDKNILNPNRIPDLESSSTPSDSVQNAPTKVKNQSTDSGTNPNSVPQTPDPATACQNEKQINRKDRKSKIAAATRPHQQASATQSPLFTPLGFPIGE
ncbi:hypothetical protein Dimus_034063 [Dionaea muscipula]